MRKLVLIVLAALLLVVGTVSAQPEDSLTALAEIFPADSLVVISGRTDDAFIQTLDALLARVTAVFPAFGTTSVSATLDSLAQSIDPEGDFDSVFRPWLGDTAALGLVMNPAEDFTPTATLLAFEITDRAAAEAFVEAAEGGAHMRSESGSVTVYRGAEDYEAVYIISDSTLLAIISGSLADRFISGDYPRLSDADGFTDTVALLPAASYNAGVYLNLPAVMAAQMQMGTPPNNPLEARFVEAFMAALGPQAYGFTILEDRTLTMDVAVTFRDTTELDALFGEGVLDMSNMPPVSTALADQLPQDTQFVIAGTALGSQVLRGFDALSAFTDVLFEELDAEMADDPFLQAQMQQFNPLREFVDLGGLSQGSLTVLFAGMTGLNLEDDVLAHLNGDYALWLNIIDVESDLPLWVDFGFTSQMDAGAAASIVDHVTDAATRYGLFFSTEAGVFVTPLLRALVFRDAPEGFDTPALDLMLAGSDSAGLILGTRPGVTAMLETDRTSLSNNPVFSAAQALLLPDASQVYFFNALALSDSLQATGLAEMGIRDVEDAMRLLSLLESGTVSITQPDASTMLGRFTLTLSAE